MKAAGKRILIDGERLTLDDVALGATGRERLAVAPRAVGRIRKSRRFVEGAIRRGDTIYVITNSSDENDKVEASITKFYGKNIGVISPKAMASTIQELMGTFIGFLSAIAAVSMLVGAVGIITTLYTSVMERTREIGLLKAIGYTRETVLFMFLTESFAIGLLGGSLGLIFGIAGAYVLIQVLPFGGPGAISINPYFLPLQLIQVFLLACGLSVVAGLYPAWRASTLNPITALKKE